MNISNTQLVLQVQACNCYRQMTLGQETADFHFAVHGMADCIHWTCIRLTSHPWSILFAEPFPVRSPPPPTHFTHKLPTHCSHAGDHGAT